MGLKLSISNIAWDASKDTEMYQFISDIGFSGLEIAPTRLFPQNPYGHIVDAIKVSEKLKNKYKLKICSMQSIWFGRSEQIFSSQEERENLIDYTKKAIIFAEAIGASNLVFGCPKNRISKSEYDYIIAIDFFRRLGNYAVKHHTIIGIEANPIISGTNFINRTQEAINFINQVNSKGIKLNLDSGTIIYNAEAISELAEYTHLINHVHISEPGLDIIRDRPIYRELMQILNDRSYKGYVSIEMRNKKDIRLPKQASIYLLNLSKKVS